MSKSNVTHWTQTHPELGTGPVPIERAMSEEFFKLERRRIFGSCWLKVGRIEELPRFGDFLVKDLPVCQTSVLLMRGKDGQVRGFHNICSHRGNKLAWDSRGNCRAGVMTCKFHGWSYNWEGRLAGVPDEVNFFDLDKSRNGLTPVATDTWQGFIFVNLDPNPAQSLKAYLGGIVEDLESYPFDQIPFSFGYWEDLNCNWKIAVDAQNEAYHAVWLHRRTIGDIFANSDDPYAHALDVKFYGPHARMSVPGYDLWHTPVRDLANRIENKWVMRQGPRFGTSDQMPKGLNPSRSDNWTFDLYMIFPNLWLGLFNGFYLIHEMWPMTVGRMRQETRMYQPPPRTASQLFTWEYQKTVNRDVWLEDFSTLEQSWEVLQSGVKKVFNLQDNEVLVRNFYYWVERMVDAQQSPAGRAA
ncbi:MAG TPA: aromatic ring-hydroxylating dioxygenase subunit alpha [Candidatus Binataceae bacterium]|jgi:phenylpropionate dioxygenase-like ring-hydroxylating dioxygenase large terminal subunit|nr:aromatic ring-hydroxylating dioxygenase subunit alpha [Candidatus Binataceae bacterium]